MSAILFGSNFSVKKTNRVKFLCCGEACIIVFYALCLLYASCKILQNLGPYLPFVERCGPGSKRDAQVTETDYRNGGTNDF